MGSFKDIPTDYKLPIESKYEFYAVVIEELKAQREAMALDSDAVTKKLSDLLDMWNNKESFRLDGEVINAVAKMKIYTDAWVKTVEEIETLKVSGNQRLISPKASKGSKAPQSNK
ncbi:hypothetical protein CTA2_12307 [Colletotrichum tanaceti]|uniref:Uncharacterized protein n=1 Tax=Colletotrichum tanaceti TaxID=1306861 RepID=A0A4U6XDM7_9PEZI|nr:hypothetical protein CTA2_12307 [Colletotrichum tanaceti]TKW53890.1 hypothetical protein CTA1_9662 [Colletotrichum tanaceti]